MASNPMQKKARNSFILGMLMTFIIMAAVVGVLLLQLRKMNEEEQTRKASLVKVCVLTEDVKSGDFITNEMIKVEEVLSSTVPKNGAADVTNLNSWFLEDKSGNRVETKKEDGKTVRNKETGKAEYQLNRDGKSYDLKEDNGAYYIELTNNGVIEKEYVELVTPQLIAKIDMKANTVVTSEMLVKSDEKTTSDLRVQEYNMLQIQSQLTIGDYIDIRLRLPNGLDYIVVSKKRVEMPQVEGVDSLSTVWLRLEEDETLAMSNAIVESYMIEGSILYTAKYVEPGMQDKSIPTFVPSREVQEAMNADPNILQVAKNELINRYNANVDTRNKINNEINRTEEDERKAAITTGSKQEVTKAQEERQSYLDALSGAE